jgi:hypothetical protein
MTAVTLADKHWNRLFMEHFWNRLIFPRMAKGTTTPCDADVQDHRYVLDEKHEAHFSATPVLEEVMITISIPKYQ